MARLGCFVVLSNNERELSVSVRIAGYLLALTLISGVLNPSYGQEKPAEEVPEKKPADEKAEDPPKQDVEQDDSKDDAAKTPNLLQRLIGNLLGSGDDENATGGKKRTKRVDPRAPFNQKLSTLLKKAESHFRAGEHRQTLETLQRLLEVPEDALWEVSPGKLISVHSAAHKLLAKLPPAELERYRTQFGDAAQRELQAALANGSLNRLAEVATRYFQTDAGFQAANQLGTRYLDRGEFGLAAFWFRELLEADAPLTKNPTWRLKAEYVALKVDSSVIKDLLKSPPATADQTIVVGGRPVARQQWLSGLAIAKAQPTPSLRDWPQFFGTARRVAQVAEGEPLLLPRWSLPMTYSVAIHERLRQLQTDLRDQDQVPIFTFHPLLVDGRIVFRSLRGVKVVSAATGDLLWETADEPSAEDMLASGKVDSYWDDPFSPQFTFMRSRVGPADALDALPASENPLTHLLYRNSNHGLLSSDGRRLFVVEDLSVLSNMQPGQYWGEDVPEHDPSGRPIGVNRLTAYDLQTGHSVWELGGPSLNDPFELPLAGSFFFGAPVVDNGDLFVVAEKDGVIRLHALDAITGQPRWSQVIANAPARINVDIGRQWLSAPVAVGDGLIVCPTTVGWLVAIDRSTHRILWAYRYQELQSDDEAEPQAEVMQPAQLNERWSPAPPVIVDDRVLFTPPDASKMICLGLSDGREKWSHKRRASLYLAGVFNGRVVTVLPNGISIHSLTHGGQQKSLKFSSPDARPAGRGVAVHDRYYVPLTTGELAVLNLETLKFETSTYLRPAEKPEVKQFGNLAMYQGMLLSLSPHGVAAFEPKLSILSELKQQLADDPHSATAAIRQAELDLLNREYDSAIAALHQVAADKLPAALRARHQAALVTALATVAIRNPDGRDAEFEELSKIATKGEEPQQLERLRSLRLLDRRDFVGAFQVNARFAERFGSQLVQIDESPLWRTRGDCWAARQLASILKSAPEDVRPALDQLVQQSVSVALAGERKQQLRIYQLYRDHPAVVPLVKKLVESYAGQGEWQLAENLLLTLQANPDQRIWARQQLAQLWQKAHFDSDAAHFYQLLQRDDAQGKWDDSHTVEQYLQELKAQGKLPATISQPICDWHNRDLVTMHAGTNYDSGAAVKDFNLRGAGLPFFRQHRLQFNLNEPRFEVVDAASEKRVWSLPVRSANDGTTAAPKIEVTGHQVVLFEGAAVSGLSPTERRQLWTHVIHDPVEGIPAASEYDNGPAVASVSSLESSSGLFTRTPGLADDWAMLATQGSTRIANQQYVSYVVRRQLVVLDAADGSVLWTREGVPVGAQLLGGTHVLYVWNPADDRVVAYSAVDGSELAIPKLSSLARRAISHVGDDLIVLESSSGLINTANKSLRLQRVNPLTQQVAWSIDIRRRTQGTCLSGRRLGLIDEDGQIQVCNLETGARQSCGAIPKTSLRADHALYLIPTYDQLLVIDHQESKFAIDQYGESFPSVRVAGTVYSFDLITGRERWKQPVASQHLILDRLDHSPIALFVARSFEQSRSGWKLALQAIDRQHGKVVHQSEVQLQSGFHQLSINMQEQYVEMRTYNDRLRLMPK